MTLVICNLGPRLIVSGLKIEDGTLIPYKLKKEMFSYIRWMYDMAFYINDIYEIDREFSIIYNMTTFLTIAQPCLHLIKVELC
jgi:hypothetical protein